MADTKAIANRIKSVRDTRKITNAMYLIASTKLRKARKSMEDTSPFFKNLRAEIGKIVRNMKITDNPYFLSETSEEQHTRGTCGILVITADKGLAGAYNQNVIRETQRLMEEFPDHRLFLIGEYGKHFFSSREEAYDKEFLYTDEEPSLMLARRVAGYIMDLYDRGEISQVYIVYTELENALSSKAQDRRLLPFEKEYFAEHSFMDEEIAGAPFVEYEYVPSPLAVMEHLIPIYCIGIVYSVLVNSFCCEQNERMQAMDAANQNADQLLSELTIRYNHLRQNSITQEITEISASVKASHRK